MRRAARVVRTLRLGGSLAAAVLLVVALSGCGSSSDEKTSTNDPASGRTFCQAARSIEAANAEQLDHILTRDEAQVRLAGQLKQLAAAASPSQGEGWAGQPVPLSKEAVTRLFVALDTCHLSMDIFGVSAAKSDAPAASTSTASTTPPTTR